MKNIFDTIFPKEKITLDNGKVVFRPRSKTPLISIIVILLMYISIKVTGFNFEVFNNFGNFFNILKGMIPPDFSYSKDVLTPLFDTIVKKNGKKALRVLTGFKYIGEKIRQFENKELDGTFLFGFEEAIGYLVGTHVRDKDAVVASMIIAEMATTFENNGSSIYNEIIKIYEKYGWRLETTVPITKKGKDGLEEIQKIMKSMRAKTHTEIAGVKVKEYRDYQKGVDNLPKADVIQMVLEDETYLTVRPSGTEPKIKFYISVVDSDKKVAEEKLARIEKEFINYAENL